MFNLEPTFTHLDRAREHVLTLVVSINAVSVKVPGIPPSPAMAYIAAWDAGGGRAGTVIYLYYSAPNRAAAYLWEPKEFPVGELPHVLDEAREFLESMGFMLDDSGFRALAPNAQSDLMAHNPLFHKDLARFAAEREANELPEADLVEMAPEPIPAPTPAPARAPAERAATPPSSPERTQRVGRLLSSF